MAKENILNYEVEMIDYQFQSLSKPESSLNHQYTTWQLDQKIFQLIGSSPCTVRWIGSHESAYLDTFVYIMLSMSLKKQSLILRLKEKIYQLSQKYLEKSSQKLIVQFLCLMQYTQDKSSFLRKYPEVLKIIVLILKICEKQATQKDNIKMSSFILESPVKEKRKQSFSVFCDRFDFISVLNLNECTYKFVSQKEIIFVIVEKDCFFVVEKFPLLSIEKDQSIQKLSSKMKNWTPRFCLSNNTLQKPRSQKKRAQNHMIHKNKKSEDLLQNYNHHSSFDCSIQEICSNLQNGQQDPQKAHKQTYLSKYQTQNQMSSQYTRTKINKSRQKETEYDRIFLIKQFESQQKRKDHWLKLQRQYYERKKQISNKNKQDKIQIKKIFYDRNQLINSQKQRKKSFNSFTGYSQKDRLDIDFAQIDYDKKSITKSHEDQQSTKYVVKERKVSLRQSPVEKKKKALKKKTSNQISINQDNRLSVIQEENRLKFWNFNNKASTRYRSPKFTSFNSSSRETLDANICVTFNYIDKHPDHSKNLLSPNFHKMRYHGSPIQV